jgi:hypothetical protein
MDQPSLSNKSKRSSNNDIKEYFSNANYRSKTINKKESNVHLKNDSEKISSNEIDVDKDETISDHKKYRKSQLTEKDHERQTRELKKNRERHRKKGKNNIIIYLSKYL